MSLPVSQLIPLDAPLPAQGNDTGGHMPRYIYTICIDDNSKLSGFSEQTVTGVGITKEDDLLMVLLEQGGYINFNWSRVRWYKRHAMPATTQD